MSALGGHDLVIEVSRDTVRRLIMAQRLSGTALVPPFEVFIPVDLGLEESPGVAHVIGEDLQVAFVPGDNLIVVTIAFRNTSLSFGGQSISPLAGELKLAVRIAIVPRPVGSRHRVVQFQLSSAAPSVTLDAASTQRVQQALGTPDGVTTVLERVVIAISTFLAKQANPSFPEKGLEVDESRDGWFTPLRLRRFDTVRCISADVLALFGIFLGSREATANPADKTVSLASGQDVCLNVSAEAIRALLFCPELARRVSPSTVATEDEDEVEGETRRPSLATEDEVRAVMALLPTCCGSADRILFDAAYKAFLTRACDQLVDGALQYDVGLEIDDPCLAISATAAYRRTYEVTNNALVAVETRTAFSTTFAVRDWCMFLYLLLFGPALGIGPTSGVKRLADHLAHTDVEAKFDEKTKARESLPKLPLNSFIPGAKFDAVQVTAGGFVIQGKWPISLPAPAKRGVKIVGTLEDDNSPRKFGDGTYHFPGIPGCPPGDYAYELYAYYENGEFRAVPTLLGKPLQIEWSLIGITAPVPVGPDPSGFVLVPVDASFPQPVPTGTVVRGRQANLDYTWYRAERLWLGSSRGNGNYSLALTVRVQDPDGNVAQDLVRLSFEGQRVRWGDDYRTEVIDCITKIFRQHGWIRETPPPIRPSIWREPPAELTELLRQRLAKGDPTAHLLLAWGRMQFGVAFDQAIR